MTRRAALSQARSEISHVYKTAANGSSVTWGVSTRLPGMDRRCQSDIGSYRDAVAGRREWIASRTAELLGEG